MSHFPYFSQYMSVWWKCVFSICGYKNNNIQEYMFVSGLIQILCNTHSCEIPLTIIWNISSVILLKVL